jgi:hypothetical protein
VEAELPATSPSRSSGTSSCCRHRTSLMVFPRFVSRMSRGGGRRSAPSFSARGRHPTGPGVPLFLAGVSCFTLPIRDLPRAAKKSWPGGAWCCITPEADRI